MWHVDHAAAPADAVQAVRAVPRGTAWPVSASAPVNAPAAGGTLSILKQRLDAAISGGRDPFSDGAPAAAAAAAAAPAPAQVALAPSEPVKPVAPFTYVGRWQEQGRTAVFLKAGDRVLTVRGPGPLEGGYVAEAITADGVTIKSATGERQVISFAAPAAAEATGGAAAAPTQTTASTPPGPPEEN